MDERLRTLESDEVTRFEPEPEPEPGAAGAPPRKPPTAVGADAVPPRDRDPHSLGSLLRLLISSLDQPVREVDLPAHTTAALERAGVKTLGQLLGLTNDRLKRLGVDSATRRRLAEWRRQLGLGR